MLKNSNDYHLTSNVNLSGECEAQRVSKDTMIASLFQLLFMFYSRILTE